MEQPDPIDLSGQQAAVLGHSTRVVEAGPGSGKTRALVARFLQTTAAGHQGVALLSFTNAAVDEVRRRTLGSPGLLKSPNFVGTIDSFLHRFIVTPAETLRLGRTPTYVASWDDLGLRPVGVGIQAEPLPLSAFHVDEAGAVSLPPGLPQTQQRYVDLATAAGRRDQLLRVGRGRIVALNERGVYDANTARVKAWQLLSGSTGDEIVRRLARRFGEILIDEAQDCDESEMAIVRRLSAATSVVVVADPDQAIYEFRGSSPGLFAAYRDGHTEVDQVVDLSVNHRSTPEICAVVSSLRGAGRSAIVPADASSGPPIMLLVGTATEQGAKFRQALKDHGISVEKAQILAHRRATVRAVLGQPAGATTKSRLNRLAIACHELRSGAAPITDRLAAVRRIERLVIESFDWADDEQTLTIARKLELLDRDAAWLRAAAGRLVSSVGGSATSEEFARGARACIEQTLIQTDRAFKPLGSQLPKPDQSFVDRLTAPPIDSEGLSGGTIHGFKGAEFAAVLLAIPRSGPHLGLDAWEAGQDAEARRVLYVAASRAQQLLAVGVTASQSQRVRALLQTAGVPIEVR